MALGSASKQIGLPLRAGLHTGEIEIRDRDIVGISRSCGISRYGQSKPGEILVLRVVTDLVAGADLMFSERGSRKLKGLPVRRGLFAASHQV
jgi:class 3 adenylate cyclase